MMKNNCHKGNRSNGSMYYWEEEIDKVPDFARTQWTLIGIAKLKERLVLLIDADKILEAENFHS